MTKGNTVTGGNSVIVSTQRERNSKDGLNLTGIHWGFLSTTRGIYTTKECKGPRRQLTETKVKAGYMPGRQG